MVVEKQNTFRREKAEGLLKRVAAEFLEIESNKTALITVTRATISPDLKNSTIFITVLPEKMEVPALDFARRKLGPFRDYAKTKLKFRILPFFSLEIDKGEKIRQQIDELSRKN